MKKTVVIFGAGASMDDGAPVMRNFLDVAGNLNRDFRFGSTDKAVFDALFEDVNKLGLAPDKASNLETVYSELVKIESQSVVSLRRLILRTLEIEMSFPQEIFRSRSPITYRAFIDAIESSLKADEVTLISFNYDFGLDAAIASRGVQVRYGLNSTDLPPNVIKPHGSINWIQCPTCKCLAVLENIDSIILGEVGKLNILAHLPFQSCHSPECTMPTLFREALPVIVPPTLNKEPYREVFELLWKHAESALLEAEKIIVIGYSMPPSDKNIREFLFEILQKTVSLQMFAVADKCENVSEQFKNLLPSGYKGEFQTIVGPFKDCIQMIGSIVG